MKRDVGHELAKHFIIQDSEQFRKAISRLRFLENAETNSPRGRERAALVRAVSYYLGVNMTSGGGEPD